jgi:hypothetical protein
VAAGIDNPLAVQVAAENRSCAVRSMAVVVVGAAGTREIFRDKVDASEGRMGRVDAGIQDRDGYASAREWRGICPDGFDAPRHSCGRCRVCFEGFDEFHRHRWRDA